MINIQEQGHLKTCIPLFIFQQKWRKTKLTSLSPVTKTSSVNCFRSKRISLTHMFSYDYCWTLTKRPWPGLSRFPHKGKLLCPRLILQFSIGHHYILSTGAPSDTSWNLHNVVFVVMSRLSTVSKIVRFVFGVGVDCLFSFFHSIHQIRRGLVVSVVH